MVTHYPRSSSVSDLALVIGALDDLPRVRACAQGALQQYGAQFPAPLRLVPAGVLGLAERYHPAGLRAAFLYKFEIGSRTYRWLHVALHPVPVLSDTRQSRRIPSSLGLQPRDLLRYHIAKGGPTTHRTPSPIALRCIRQALEPPSLVVMKSLKFSSQTRSPVDIGHNGRRSISESIEETAWSISLHQRLAVN